jgi:hypothetical protein
LIRIFPDSREAINQAFMGYSLWARYLILLSVTTVSIMAHRRWRSDSFSLCALAVTIFLLLVPGFGVQYLAYLPPFLCMVNARLALFFSTLSGIFVALIYFNFLNNLLPLTSIHTGPIPLSLWPTNLAIWLTCLFVLWRILKLEQTRFENAREVSSAAPDPS